MASVLGKEGAEADIVLGEFVGSELVDGLNYSSDVSLLVFDWDGQD